MKKLLASSLLLWSLFDGSSAYAQVVNKALSATVTVSTNTADATKIKDGNKATVWTGTKAFDANRFSYFYGYFVGGPEKAVYTWSSPQSITGYTISLPVSAGESIKSQEMTVWVITTSGQQIKVFPGGAQNSQIISFQDCANPNNPNACSWGPNFPAISNVKSMEFYSHRRLNSYNQPQVGAQFSEIKIR